MILQLKFLKKWYSVLQWDPSSDDYIITWKCSPVSSVFFKGYNPEAA